MRFSDQIKFSGTTPSDLAVTLAEAKSQLNITHSDEDTFITSLITAATQYAERLTGRSLVIRSWEYIGDFPGGTGPDAAFILPVSPVVAVTSVKYYDTDGTQQTMSASDYVSQTGDYASIYPASGNVWPTTDANRLHPVSVIFTAGYDGTADSPVDLGNIPDAISQAILLHVAHLYENREAVAVDRNIDVDSVPLAYDALLSPYRVKHF